MLFENEKRLTDFNNIFTRKIMAVSLQFLKDSEDITTDAEHIAVTFKKSIDNAVTSAVFEIGKRQK